MWVWYGKVLLLQCRKRYWVYCQQKIRYVWAGFESAFNNPVKISISKNANLAASLPSSLLKFDCAINAEVGIWYRNNTKKFGPIHTYIENTYRVLCIKISLHFYVVVNPNTNAATEMVLANSF